MPLPAPAYLPRGRMVQRAHQPEAPAWVGRGIERAGDHRALAAGRVFRLFFGRAAPSRRLMRKRTKAASSAGHGGEIEEQRPVAAERHALRGQDRPGGGAQRPGEQHAGGGRHHLVALDIVEGMGDGERIDRRRRAAEEAGEDEKPARGMGHVRRG